MTGTLKVDPAKLKSAASSFESTGRQIQRLTASMTQSVNQMTGNVWSGDAASAYKKKFDSLQDDINRMIRMINEHVADLKQMASEYEKSETQNQNLVNSLKSDVIS